MNKITILTFFLFFLFMQKVDAQIMATTSAGKKVVLNLDGTWKYANADDAESTCQKNKTGNLTIKNNTSNDIYFYYSATGNVSNTKIKAGASKTISNLKSTTSYGSKLSYDWLVSYELYSINTASRVMYLEGFERGEIGIESCETQEIDIEE
ncbi:MAG: hypothetical protein IPP60_03660 [Sphingobacteriales bacterium]|nr:hypothetical protein [Sphingobacteriales bacterium]